MKRNRHRRRGISLGTVLLLLLTSLSLGMVVWLLPKLTDDNLQDLRVDSQRLLGTLSETIAQPGEHRPSPQTQEVAGEALPTPIATLAPTATPTTRLISIVAAGSVTIPKNVRLSGKDGDTDTYSYESIFGDMQALLSGADLALCTVESAFAGQEAGFGDYNAPDAMLDALKFAGIDLVSLGNERALDKGIDGLRTTLMTMESKGMLVTGAAANPQEVGRAQIVQVNGVEIAVLAYSYGISNEGQKSTKKDDRFATPIFDAETVRADIAGARKAGADLVIVLPHWGSRNSTKISAAQKKQAEQLVAMGADIVLGAHPNVVQRVERVQATGEDGQAKEAIVAYSLGSLLSDGRDLVNASGMLLYFDVQVDFLARTARVVRYGYVPTWIRREKKDGVYVYNVLRADDEETIAQADSVTQNRLKDANRTVQKALQDGIEVPVYWP